MSKCKDLVNFAAYLRVGPCRAASPPADSVPPAGQPAPADSRFRAGLSLLGQTGLVGPVWSGPAPRPSSLGWLPGAGVGADSVLSMFQRLAHSSPVGNRP